ncbi:pimeloyl-ACP methyl ester carboxylesterase [Catenuloplanes nepalensis]|uniref:Pimeloyl-ACP methyl ester carboxylesterase n=1 Tax=Catenuloplanes nepalensis TaxID=587533 RepID=A0ABT9MXE1_9ACTN|nr:alpha/beta hydrolase [Catenuloplanes nepalensis]MDP9796112.1 pimeloyl-ACP methyl ester carboxylesterase [Catenuloplanes nepalensis]
MNARGWLVIAALAATVVATPGGAHAASPHDRTSVAESRRVDAVPTPVLSWSACFEIAECATVPLPLDYDEPHGATTEVAVLRVKARDQANKVGSLFVNPGGPSVPATGLALAAPHFMSDEVLDRFDIVGVDPRGIGRSERVQCFASTGDQAPVMADLSVAFPVTKAEKAAYVRGSQQYGRACSTTGRPLSGAMSTAEVARDHDVLRRAVGDDKLTFLGLSYGSVLGQYYANMFPDRFRAVAIDGVLDARAWVGDTRRILDERIDSAGGASKAFTEILRRCDRAGETTCAFADGDPAREFDAIARRLKAKPLVVGEFTVTYADFVFAVLSAMDLPSAGEDVTGLAADTRAALDGDSAALLRRLRNAAENQPPPIPGYDNRFDSFLGVLCGDGRFPAHAARWPAAVAAREAAVPHFGGALGWNDSACAGDAWTVRDEDAYTGPFNRRTAAPVLVVGSYWDPATSYANAVSTSRSSPNSRLLSSDNWGHTAYGSSDCATATIDAYLLTGTPPARDTVCTGAPQPFTGQASAGEASARRAGKQPPPIVPPRPGSVLTGR